MKRLLRATALVLAARRPVRAGAATAAELATARQLSAMPPATLTSAGRNDIFLARLLP